MTTDDGLGLSSGEIDVIVLHDGTVLQGHGAARCAGEACCIHNPSQHALNRAPLNWRDDRSPAFMERRCEHGIGHPDPDSIAYVRQRDPKRAEGIGVHGCDGCCREPEPDIDWP